MASRRSSSKNRRKNQSSDSKDVIISNKNKRISDLEKRVRELEVDSGYKEKYKQACKERDMYKKLSEETIKNGNNGKIQDNKARLFHFNNGR